METNKNWLDRVPWQSLLDVVNCAQHGSDILRQSAYICTTIGSAYQHRRCKYFGSYSDKTVGLVALIVAVVDLYSANSLSVQWKNVEEPAEPLLQAARERHAVLRPNKYPQRIFLLDDISPTNFQKDSPGGMQSSKRYFDVTRLAPTGSKDLAEKLRSRTWSMF